LFNFYESKMVNTLYFQDIYINYSMTKKAVMKLILTISYIYIYIFFAFIRDLLSIFSSKNIAFYNRHINYETDIDLLIFFFESVTISKNKEQIVSIFLWQVLWFFKLIMIMEKLLNFFSSISTVKWFFYLIITNTREFSYIRK
jgi:hypothetical protein